MHVSEQDCSGLMPVCETVSSTAMIPGRYSIKGSSSFSLSTWVKVQILRSTPLPDETKRENISTQRRLEGKAEIFHAMRDLNT